MTILHLVKGQCARCDRPLAEKGSEAPELCPTCHLEIDLFERDRRWTIRD